jgi:hypothetical protein
VNFKENGKAHLDIRAANIQQLSFCGLSEDRIHVADYCTMHQNELFFSYRREGKGQPSGVGRLLSVIGKLARSVRQTSFVVPGRDSRGATVEKLQFVVPGRDSRGGVLSRNFSLSAGQLCRRRRCRQTSVCRASPSHPDGAPCRQTEFVGLCRETYDERNNIDRTRSQLHLNTAKSWEDQLSRVPKSMETRLGFMTRQHHLVRYFVVRTLPRIGKPIPPETIATKLKMPVRRVNAILNELEEKLFFLVRDELGEISWAYPFTTAETPHRLSFNTGERIYAA